MSEYQHGAQDISQHNETYGRVMDITIWSSGLIGVGTLFFTLVFAAKMAWLPSLAISLVVAIAAGMLLRRSGVWHAVMIGLAILTLILGFFISFIAGMG